MLWVASFLALSLELMNMCAAQTIPVPPESTQGQLPSTARLKPTEPIRVSGGVMAGHLLKKVTPEYPADAIAKHVSGATVLHVIIGRDGLVKSVSVVTGPPALRDAMVSAVKQWVYEPYLLSGAPVEVDTVVTIHLQIGG